MHALPSSHVPPELGLQTPATESQAVHGPQGDPQSTLTPQLSFTVPHLPAHVVTFELLVQPHMPAVLPPPHVWGEVQSLSEQHFACKIQIPAPHSLYPVEQL